MKNKTITQQLVAALIRKPLPPPSRPFTTGKKDKAKRGDWKKEQW